MVRASEAGDRLAVLRRAARGLQGKLRGLGEERGRLGRGGAGEGAESAARGGGAGEGAGPAAFPAGSPEEALRGLGPFPPALWDKVQAAPEAEFARTERWHGLGHDVAEINRLAAPLLADIGAAVRRPDLHARPAFVHHVMGLACDLAQVNVCADLLGLAEEVQTHCAAARLWGKATRGDPGALAEALGRAVRDPVRGLQGALQPLGDFGAVVAEVFPAVSLLYRLEELQATGALDIDQEFRPPAGCRGWEFLAHAGSTSGGVAGVCCSSPRRPSATSSGPSFSWWATRATGSQCSTTSLSPCGRRSSARCRTGRAPGTTPGPCWRRRGLTWTLRA